jgi:hypothetical protein
MTGWISTDWAPLGISLSLAAMCMSGVVVPKWRAAQP